MYLQITILSVFVKLCFKVDHTKYVEMHSVEMHSVEIHSVETHSEESDYEKNNYIDLYTLLLSTNAT